MKNWNWPSKPTAEVSGELGDATMIQRQLKLRLTRKQEVTLEGWLWNLTGAWNTAIRRLELDAKDGVFHSKFDMMAQTVGHSLRVGIPASVLDCVFAAAHDAWSRHRRGLANRPRLKSARRPLRSIPLRVPVRRPVGNKISWPFLGKLRFHGQDIPGGAIKCSRIVRRASGWYLCLFIDAERAPIDRVASGPVGIDPGFSSLLTLSTGEKVTHPREIQAAADRLAQAQRGRCKRLTARLHERVGNQKKDRNHKLSLRLVREFTAIYFSKDNIAGIARRFGKSVACSNHHQLREMLRYKSLSGGTEYVEVDSKCSTRICSSCGAHTGPRGWGGLKVRNWACSACGSQHDRDVNAAICALNFGAGLALERRTEPTLVLRRKSPATERVK